MSNNTDDFLSVGLKKYKQASAILVSFGQEMEEPLQGILNDRATEKWAPFRPGETKRAKSTRYWSHYPLLNDKIDGDIAGCCSGVGYYDRIPALHLVIRGKIASCAL